MNLHNRPTRLINIQRPGFSLVEILVIISIMLVLMALGVAGVQRIRESAVINQTKSLLAKLDAINTEYQVQARQTITYPDPLIPSENVNDMDDKSITKFYTAASLIPTCKTMLDSIKSDGLMTDANIIQDPWENAIQYRSRVDSNPPLNPTNHLPPHSSPFFASAGPDLKWGNINSATEADKNDAKDNIYSYNTTK